MRRAAPRPLRAALEQAVESARPATALARLQAAWPAAVGAAIAAESQPVAERNGVVSVACRSAAWAQELELLSGDLLERLNVQLGGLPAVAELRFRSGMEARP